VTVCHKRDQRRAEAETLAARIAHSHGFRRQRSWSKPEVTAIDDGGNLKNWQKFERPKARRNLACDRCVPALSHWRLARADESATAALEEELP
jgi:hypothetical protein